MFIVKLVPALMLARRGTANPVSDVVLQVTPVIVFAALGWIKISLVAATALTSTTHVPPEVPVSQEICPAVAAPQEIVPEDEGGRAIGLGQIFRCREIGRLIEECQVSSRMVHDVQDVCRGGAAAGCRLKKERWCPNLDLGKWPYCRY